MEIAGLSTHPLCRYFLAGYLSHNDDPVNFPPDNLGLLDNYERVFTSGLEVLGLTKEALRARSDFDFDSEPGNLEGGIGTLRAISVLQSLGFANIALVKPPTGSKGADLSAQRDGLNWCFEVKAITKQSSPASESYEDGLYKKILDSLPRARKQLESTAAELACEAKIAIYVVNWFEQSLFLDLGDYQRIVNRLERDCEQESLLGVDGVLFVKAIGDPFFFLSERLKLMVESRA